MKDFQFNPVRGVILSIALLKKAEAQKSNHLDFLSHIYG